MAFRLPPPAPPGSSRHLAEQIGHDEPAVTTAAGLERVEGTPPLPPAPDAAAAAPEPAEAASPPQRSAVDPDPAAADPLAHPASIPAPYRSRHPRRTHPYRAAALLAAMFAGGAVATWFAAAEILLAVEQGAAALRRLDGESPRAMVATALVAAALLSLIVAWGRATSPRRPVRLADGRGRMAVETLEARLREAIVADPDVRDARVWIENLHRRGVRVDVHLRVEPQARIDDAVDGVDAAAEELLHRRAGVPMDGLPLVDVSYDELDLRAGRAHG